MKIATFNQLDGGPNEAAASLDSPETLVIVFGSSTILDDASPVNNVVKLFPSSKIVGCSTAGEIYGEAILDVGLAVAVLKFEKSTLKLASAPVESAEDSFRAGELIAESLDSPDLRGVIVLSDGLHVNGSRLVAGLNSVFSPSVVVSGGLAGDGADFSRTWVLKDGRPTTHVVSAVGLYGDELIIGHGSKGGWDIFGPERKVTRSRDNQLFELDGKPALDLYKNYLGDLAAELPASALMFPLSLRKNSFDEKRIVRTILSVDEGERSMTFAGDLPEGSLVQLMRANFDRLIDGASEAALMTARSNRSRDEVFSLAISCVGRRLVLGERAEEELEAVLEELPPKTHQVGFYSYGEISPYATGYCDLHNQTMTLTTIAEK